MARRRVSRTRLVVVTESGAFLSGQATPIIAAFRKHAVNAVADLGVNEIHRRLADVLVDPTGAYQSHIVTDRQLDDLVKITDSKMIYGPWLEGESGRNQTTRFKGYRTFRKTRASLKKLATPTVQKLLDRYVARLNA